jgi:hypothetical protein
MQTVVLRLKGCMETVVFRVYGMSIRDTGEYGTPHSHTAILLVIDLISPSTKEAYPN